MPVSIQLSTSSDMKENQVDREEGENAHQDQSSSRTPWLFLSMTRCTYPFLVTLPFLFILLICLGFSRPNIVEEDVSNLWIPSDGSYKQAKDYARSVGADGPDDMSAFAAMALSRHGDNLFKEENLNLIKERMQRIETTPLTYKGVNYTWDDICWSNEVGSHGDYSMPCLRLSPMDLFLEARWYFTEDHRSTWYQEVRSVLVKPLVIRYGIMLDMCTTASEDPTSTTSNICDATYLSRTNPQYAADNGYPDGHSGSITGLLKDLHSMSLSDPCRICIESGIDEKISNLQYNYVIPAFTTLTQQLRRFLFFLEESDGVSAESIRMVESLIRKTASIAAKTSWEDVKDFYMHYTLRRLYGEGKESYQKMYREVNNPTYRGFICDMAGIQCPPEDVTLEEAKETLMRHADNTFSSHVSFGAPFPWWSESDGTGYLFAGSKQVGGSGINMSASLESLFVYLDLENRESQNNWRPFFYDSRKKEGYVDPLGSDYLWETMVSTNPVYAWFMAGETEMTAHCGNGDLKGTNSSDMTVDALTAQLVKEYSPDLCTNYTVPFREDATYTQQHFARMWYNLLIDSPFVLEITEGESDPYIWTSGAGCGYDLGYSRFSYTGQSEETILANASTDSLYNIDEGVEVGVIDRTALIGDVYPAVGEYSLDNPIQHVGLLQSFYAALTSEGIVERVQNENRPQGPLNITVEEAREILARFKIQFEKLWSEGWDNDNDGEIQFVGFFDDADVPGTMGLLLNDVTMSSGLLTAISILVIALFLGFFLASRNPVESRIGITLLGVILVMLAFFASVGLGILLGININLTIAWTLPFVIVGLGVDNLYIVLLSMQKQKDYSDKSFFCGMTEVVIPITMTSLVNLSMFAVMNVNSIPAVYLTARVAAISVIFLYLTVVFCFPAWCYLDMKRQDEGRRDLLCWKTSNIDMQKEGSHPLEYFLYNRCYKAFLFGNTLVCNIVHALIWSCAALLLGIGLYGISVSSVGLGLEDFLPSHHQGHLWAVAQSEILGSWLLSMNWPALDYSDPNVQMRVIKQFEDVASTPYVVEIDTRRLWIAEMAIWTTRQCDYNSEIKAPDDKVCGRDKYYSDGSICGGSWRSNINGLRVQYFSDDSEDTCQPYDGGVCRPTSRMHPQDLMDLGIDPRNISEVDLEASWCPVFGEDWTEEKFTFCVRTWFEIVDGSGGLVLDPDAECLGQSCMDYMVKVPIPYSRGPTMTASDVVSHESTLEMMQQTRAHCDDDPSQPCWMSGPPFDYWSQYENISMNLVEISGAALLIAFGISWLFLAGKLFSDRRHGAVKVIAGSLVGAMLIASTCLFCLVAVVGISILAGVSFTAFSIMSFVLSVGFAVEYSVHIVARWLRSDQDSATERAEQTMSFLMLPTFMSFVSSSVGVICLAFTDFDFNTRFFFRPLITVMFVTYFFACYWLPVFLTWLDFDFVKLGPARQTSSREKTDQDNDDFPDIQVAPESHDMEESTSVYLNSRSSDTSVIVTSIAAGCLSAIGNNQGALEFLPCYASMQHSILEGKSDHAVDESERMKIPPSEDTSSAAIQCDNAQPDTVSSFLSNDSSLLAANNPPVLSTVSSSQSTVVMNNARCTTQRKSARNPSEGMLYHREVIQEETHALNAASFVPRLLTNSPVDDSRELAAVSTESSNVFDGVDGNASSDADELQQPPVERQQYRSVSAGSSRPHELSPYKATHAVDGPSSEESVAPPTNTNCSSEGRSSNSQLLSGPGSNKNVLTSPHGSFQNSLEHLEPSSDNVYLLDDVDFVGLGTTSSYDFGCITSESKQIDSSPSSSGHNVATREPGEVRSVL